MTRYLSTFLFIIVTFFSSISLSNSNEELGYILKALKNTGQHNLLIKLINQSNLYDCMPLIFYLKRLDAMELKCLFDGQPLNSN